MFDGLRGNQSEWGFEAPVMFKRHAHYFILFGPFCCFCYQVRWLLLRLRWWMSFITPPLPIPHCIESQTSHSTQGSGVRVYTSRSPLGPYTYQGGSDIACEAQSPSGSWASGPNAEPTPGQGCLFYGENLTSVTRAQQNFVIEVSQPVHVDKSINKPPMIDFLGSSIPYFMQNSCDRGQSACDVDQFI